MSTVKSKIEAKDPAHVLPFAPSASIVTTDVQRAIEAVQDNLETINAALAAPDYLVKTASATLTGERVVTDTATVAWDWATAAQAKAAVVDGSLANAKLADMAQATVKGRAAGAGTGVPTDLSDAQLLAILKAVDGSGSGLDADTLDGVDSLAFALYSVLASNSNALGASLIGIEDAGSYFSQTTVEAALAFIGARIASLDAAVVLRGAWDASAGTFPGSGSAQAGDSYIVSVAGTVNSIAFSVGDRIIAITDNASTSTYASNWLKADYSDLVSSVAGRVGAVTIALADITDASANGRTLAAHTFAQMRADLDLEAGTDFYSKTAADAAFEPINANLLKANATANLTKGYTTTVYVNGSQSGGGTLTPDPANGQIQKCVNHGAFTLAPDGDTHAIFLDIVNDSSAGAITTSGFTKVKGDSFTTTDGHIFRCSISNVAGVGSLLIVAALQ